MKTESMLLGRLAPPKSATVQRFRRLAPEAPLPLCAECEMGMTAQKSWLPQRASPPNAPLGQTAGIRMRQAYWNHVAPFSGSAGTTAGPFFYSKTLYFESGS